MKAIFVLGLVITLFEVNSSNPLDLTESFAGSNSDVEDRRACNKIIIAHRGASGYVPEHTLGSYALAATMGADYVEPDLVSTKDRQLVALHDNELSTTTDIALHPEFASRRRTQTVDGKEMTGWFTEDFTLAELKTLRVIERIPLIRPGNARMDGSYTIPTFQEILDLIRGLQISLKRKIGVYPEIKHSTHFQKLGLPMETTVINTLHRNGYGGPNSPVYIQSFEVDNLKFLSKIAKFKLIQLLDSDKNAQPADQVASGSNLTYGAMATPEGLREVAKYATAVGPDKSFIIPVDEDKRLGKPTSFVADSHAAGLQVHPYTFRAENMFLPANLQSDRLDPDAFGKFEEELQVYLDAGIDGLFSDQPDIAVRVRGNCSKK